MSRQDGISGTAVTAVLAGSVLAYSGLKGKGIGSTVRSFLAGNVPANGADAKLAINVGTGVAANTTPDGKDNIGSGVGGGAPTAAAARAVAFAQTQLGKPYVFGAAGPDSWDCSGLIMVAYRQSGITLPHSTFAMIAIGKNVTNKTLLPGDLIFPHAAHVQLYIGGGQEIEAYDTGFPVRIAAVSKIWQARRVTG